MMGKQESILLESWPQYDENALKVEEVEIAVQVNGKVRDKIKVPVDADEEVVKQLALNSDRIKKYLDGEPKKVVYVKGRLLSITV